MTYTILVKDPQNNATWELVPNSWYLTISLNKEPTLICYLSFEKIKELAEVTQTTTIHMLSATRREVSVFFGNTKVFDGAISSIAITPLQLGNKTIELRALGWFAFFKKRLVGKGTPTVFTNQDAGQIAWSIINASQNDDPPYSSLGITQGTIQLSKNRNREYLFDVVYDSIVNLTRDNIIDGFDFEIDTDRKFNVFYPKKGITRDNIVFHEANTTGWRYEKSLFLDMTNTVWVLGEGMNSDILFSQRTASVSDRALFGTLEEKLKADNVTQVSTLDDKGDRLLAKKKQPIVSFQEVEHYEKDISFLEYDVGDTVLVHMPSIDIQSEPYRVREKTFSMDQDSVAKVRVKLERE